jgi:hypothetical protein
MEYITGSGRGNSGYELQEETHVYEVRGDSYLPLCKRGFNRDFGDGISIFRGSLHGENHCRVCIARQEAGLPGLGWKRPRKLKKKILRMR